MMLLFENVGRLTVTTENGRLADGTFDQLYTFGGRGFSVWRTDTMTRVYDSGSEIEDTLARLRPDIFNADIENNHVIDQTVDHRSDNKVGVTMPELAGQSTCLPSTCSSTKIRNNVGGHLVREKGP